VVEKGWENNKDIFNKISTLNMTYKNIDLIKILPTINLGDGVAEQDELLQVAKIETSVFSDLLKDRVDLIPGTKGSGKSALYRIFVEFLPKLLLEHNKVVIAHGIDSHGDPIFHAYQKEFEKLTEDEFVDFWCIYFVSLAHEQFIKNKAYEKYLENCKDEIKTFREACEKAKIPEIQGKKTLKEILSWCLNALKEMRPALAYKLDTNEVKLTLFGSESNDKKIEEKEGVSILPIYVADIKIALEKILKKSNLNIWLMVDRLDEVFPRRSELEKRALRGLLKTTRFFTSPEIRIKLFVRDDILSNIVNTGQGFTAIDHVTSRQADTLRWEENQILDLVVKRLVTNDTLCDYLKVDMDKLAASAEYRREVFYMVFPSNVYKGKKQSNTMRWICTHTADGNNVVTPRDIIYLIKKAIQRQQDLLKTDENGMSTSFISPQAITYGHEELSKYKRTSILEAEFPHLWIYIKKLVNGKTEYQEKTLATLFGKNWEEILSDLVSVGVLSKNKNEYKVPFLYREGLDVTQGSL